MIVKERIVRVSDTDCTKALYFTSLLKFTQEAFEDTLRTDYPELCKQFAAGKIALPIVHTEANFSAPIKVGDVLKIHLDIEFKNTSFIIKADIFHDGEKKGNVSITHVCISLETKKRLLCEQLFGSSTIYRDL